MKLIFSAFLAMLLSQSASAGVIWTLNNFIFDDGAFAEGEFEWEGGTAISWSFTLSPELNVNNSSSFISPVNYSSSGSGEEFSSSLDTLRFVRPINIGMTTTTGVNLARDYIFAIGVEIDSLATPSARLELQTVAGTGFSTDFYECANCSPIRRGLGGAFLSANVPDTQPENVPTPTTLALLGLGIAGLGWKRRKKA